MEARLEVNIDRDGLHSLHGKCSALQHEKKFDCMHILAPYAGLAVKTFGGGRGSQHNDMGIDYDTMSG